MEFELKAATGATAFDFSTTGKSIPCPYVGLSQALGTDPVLKSIITRILRVVFRVIPELGIVMFSVALLNAATCWSKINSSGSSKEPLLLKSIQALASAGLARLSKLNE